MAEQLVCTGIAAAWCPIHGDCLCRDEDGEWETLDNPDCPLHSPNSDHAEAPAQDNRLRVRCPVCRYSALVSPLDAPHVDCGTCGIPMVADARTPEDS